MIIKIRDAVAPGHRPAVSGWLRLAAGAPLPSIIGWRVAKGPGGQSADRCAKPGGGELRSDSLLAGDHAVGR